MNKELKARVQPIEQDTNIIIIRECTGNALTQLNDHEVELLWEEFSEERYCAGFMSPGKAIAVEFISWCRDE